MDELMCCICQLEFSFSGYDKFKKCIPYMLPCYHSVCSDCIKKVDPGLEHSMCKVCNTKPDALIPEDKRYFETILPVNFHALGLIMYESILKTGHYNIFDKKASVEVFIKHEKDEKASVPCSKCKTIATCMCTVCDLICCNICFIKFHNSISINNHTKIPLKYSEYFTKPTNCENHEKQVVTMYCKDCSRNICHYCLLVSKSKSPCKDHDVVTFEDEVTELQKYVNDEKSKIFNLYLRLEETEKAIDAKEKVLCLKHIKNDISKHFRKVHAALQLAEFDMLSEIVEIPKSNLTPIKDSLLKSKSEVKELIDMIKLSSDPSHIELIDFGHVARSIKQALDIPWYFDGDSCVPELSVSTDKELLNNLKNLCTLNKTDSSGFKLLTSSEISSQVLNTLNEVDIENINGFLPEKSSPKNSLIQTSENVCEKYSDSSMTMSPQQKFVLDDTISVESVMNEFAEYKVKPAFYDEYTYKNMRSHDNISTRHIKKKNRSQIDFHPPISGSIEEVIVSHINSPLDFYVQLATHQNIIQDISEQRCPNCEISIESLTPGKMLVYLDKQDNNKYRVRVIKSLKYLVEVQFLDYGHIDAVSIHSLSMVNTKYGSTPPLAYQCFLVDCVAPKDGWTSEDVMSMHSLVKGKYCTLKVVQTKGLCLGVNLLISHRDGGLISLKDCLQLRQKPLDTEESYQPIADLTPNQDYVLRIGSLNTNDEVIILNVVTPNLFYVRKVSDESTFNKLCEELNSSLNINDEGDKINYLKNGLYIACFVPKYNWCRGYIKRVVSMQKIHIFLVDHGVVVNLECSALRSLPIKFLDNERMSIECSLSGIKLKQVWHSAAVKLLIDCSKSWNPSKVKVNNVTKYLHMVELFSCIDNTITSVNLEIVKRGYAKPFNFRSTHKKTAVKTSKSKVSIPNDDLQIEKKILQNKKLEEDELGIIPVKIISAENPSEIYVRLMSDEAELTEFSEKLQEYYKTAKPNFDSNWEINDRCAVFSTTKSIWCRGYINELNEEEGSCKVFLKDEAVLEEINIADLYELHEQFLTVRDGTFKCFLTGISPALGTRWPRLLCEYLQEITSEYSKYAISKDGMIHNKSLPVQLWVYYTNPGGALEPSIKEWRKVHDMIIEQGLAIRDTNNIEKNAEALIISDTDQIQVSDTDQMRMSDSAQNLLESIIGTPPLSTFVEKTWKPPLMPKREFIGIPTHVDDDFNVYICDIDTKRCTLEFINVYNAEKFENSSPQPGDMFWNPNQPCIVQWSLDNNYYRGQTVEILENNCVLVRFIDYGNDSVCPILSLRKNIVLEDVPTVALKCKVVGVKPIGKTWAESTIDIIHKTIAEKRCQIEILGTNEEKDLLYVKLILPNNVNLVDLSVAMGFAEYDDYPQMVEIEWPPSEEAEQVENSDIIIDSCDNGLDAVEDFTDTYSNHKNTVD